VPQIWSTALGVDPFPVESATKFANDVNGVKSVNNKMTVE
jgi:osmotically-inducible protein OsmY